jgi:hypothetical protein
MRRPEELYTPTEVELVAGLAPPGLYGMAQRRSTSIRHLLLLLIVCMWTLADRWMRSRPASVVGMLQECNPCTEVGLLDARKRWRVHETSSRRFDAAPAVYMVEQLDASSGVRHRARSESVGNAIRARNYACWVHTMCRQRKSRLANAWLRLQLRNWECS